MTSTHATAATAVVFPFDLFGSGGTAEGAVLVADGLREVLSDNRRERVPTRAQAYTQHVRLKEFAFETLEHYEDWRPRCRQAVSQVLAKRELLFLLSGNHLGVLPLYDALAGEENTLIVQLDAHLDIHHFRDCTPEPSHGNFLRHVAGPMPPLINVGHRDLLLPEDEISRFYRAHYSMEQLACRPEAILDELRARSRAAQRVFLDIDCDVLDPTFFPAVAEPVPFGLTPGQLLAVVSAVAVGPLSGVALSEFDPARDTNDRGLATLVWLLEWLLLRHFERSGA